MNITGLLQDIKIAIVTSGMTTLGGISHIIELIPDTLLSKITLMTGICLSIVLIYTHLRKGNAELEKLRLESALLTRKLQQTENAD